MTEIDYPSHLRTHCANHVFTWRDKAAQIYTNGQFRVARSTWKEPTQAQRDHAGSKQKNNSDWIQVLLPVQQHFQLQHYCVTHSIKQISPMLKTCTFFLINEINTQCQAHPSATGAILCYLTHHWCTVYLLEHNKSDWYLLRIAPAASSAYDGRSSLLASVGCLPRLCGLTCSKPDVDGVGGTAAKTRL